MIKVHFKANPFTEECLEYRFKKPRGLDLLISDVCKKACKNSSLPNASTLYHVIQNCSINTNIVAKKDWAEVAVRDKDVIQVVLLPRGGGGEEGKKNPLAMVLGVLVSILAAVASFGVAGAITGVGGYVVAAAVGAAISVAGSLAINAIFPAQVSQQPAQFKKDNDRFSITTGRNQLAPYQSLPVVLGRIKATPIYLSKPIVSAAFNETRFSTVLLWGYADYKRMNIGDLFIGDKPLNDVAYVTDLQHYFLNSTDDGVSDQTVVNTPIAFNKSVSVKYIGRGKASFTLTFPAGLYAIAPNGAKITATANFYVEGRRGDVSKWKKLFGYDAPVSGNNSFINSSIDKGMNPQPTGVIWVVYIEVDTSGAMNMNPRVVIRPDIPGAFWTNQLYLLDEYYGIITDYRSDKTQFVLDVNGFSYIDDYGHHWEMRYGTIGSGTLRINELSITDNTTAAKTMTFDFTDNKPSDTDTEYWIRIMGLTAPVSNAATSATLSYITVKKTFSAFNYRYPLSFTKMQLKGTDRLNGVLDTVSGIVCSTAPVYNEAIDKWELGDTNNPASLILYVLTGFPNERRIKVNQEDNFNLPWTTVDKIAFQEFFLWCAKNNYAYNRYLTEAVGVWELCQSIASVARSFVVLSEGRWSIKTDKIQDTPKYLITPFNSWGASTQRALPDIPHALRLTFINETKTYKNDERIVYSDGYNEFNSEIFQQETVEGITNPDQIYRYGREVLKAASARLETHTVNMDWENLALGLRDRVLFSYDYLMNSLGGGRIKEIITDKTLVTAIKIDNDFIMDLTKKYAVVIRRENMSLLTLAVKSIENTDILEFINPQSEAMRINVGQLVVFGEYDNIASDCIVSKIEQEDDLTAKVTLVDYAPSIYEDPSLPVPPFDSNIQDSTPAFKVPASPSGLSLAVTYIDTSMGREYLVVLSWVAPANSPIEVEEYEVFSKKTGEEYIQTGFTKNTYWYYNGSPSEYKAFRVRAVSKYHVVSDFAELIDPITSGLPIAPVDVQMPISTAYVNQKLNIYWEPVYDKRPVSYEIRRGKTWGSGQVLGVTHLTNYTVPANGLYWIKSKIFGDIYSKNATLIEIEGANMLVDNVIVNINEAPKWAGLKENFQLHEDGYIKTSAVNAIYTIPENERVELANNNLPCNINIFYDALAYIANDIFAASDIFSMNDIFARSDETFLIYPQMRIKKDGVWGDWQNFISGQHIGECFDFRLISQQVATGSVLSIENFDISIDVPDRLETFDNLQIPEEGLNVVFENGFNIVPAWQASIVDATGDEDIEILKNDISKQGLFVRIKKAGEYIPARINLFIQGY